MPVTRRRAAATAPVVVQVDDGEEEDERYAAIDISSGSEAGSESRSEDEEDSESEDSESEEEDTSDEDFVEISDSDSEVGDGEDSSEDGSGAEVEPEHLGADRSDAACNKIASLLRSGRGLERIKLVECKAYLKKIGLSQTGDIAICVDRIMLHWRFKDADPESIYPRSSFCINCKGDVCRGDAVLFKQKVYEKSGKRHAKCIGKRVVAGKIIKESYGKEKQQHTFTIQVFWSKGAGRLPPLHLLLVKGRNLYRMMTFRQHWANEAERQKILEEKHSRGDDARRVRALNRPKSAGNNLKGKTKLKKEKHKSQSGRPDCRSNITEVNKGKKRPVQSSKFDLPNKRSRKEVSPVPSGKKCTGSRRAKKNHDHLDKSICTGHGSSSSLCNDNREKNNSALRTNCHIAPGSSSTEFGMRKRVSGSEHQNRIGGRQAQFGGRYVIPGTHVEANHGNFVVIQHPSSKRPQWHPPLRDVANALPHPGGGNHPGALFNTTVGFQHQNGAMTSLHAPAHYRGCPPIQQRAAFPSPNMPQTVYHTHPEAAYVVPRFRYPSGGTGFRQ